MLRLILQVYSSGSEPEPGYDFAYVELTTRRVRLWLDYLNDARTLTEKNAAFHSFALWEANVYYCTTPSQGFDELFVHEWFDRYDALQYGIEPQSFAPPTYEVQVTECDLLKVHTLDLWWTAVPKNGDTHLSTAMLSTAILDAFLLRLRGN